MPNADTHMSRTLQEDDTSLAYEFARKVCTLPTSHLCVCRLTRACLCSSRATPPRIYPRKEFTRRVQCFNIIRRDGALTTHCHPTQVTARRFCLVSADHPLVSAIAENAEKLQSAPPPFHKITRLHTHAAPFCAQWARFL
jgi:hypothetical protein